MVRPFKKSIDYFSLDVDIAEDDKIALIEAQHGVEGFGVIIRLLCKIYKDKGYYYEWSEKTKLLFSRRVGLDRVYVEEIINNAIKWDFFNKKVFDKYSVLTSARIQKNYLSATRRREEVEIIEEFLVLNDKDVNNINDIASINFVNVSNNKQSKVKESKVKESKEKKSVYGEDKKVKLTQKQYKKLKTKLGKKNRQEYIDRVNDYICQKGKKYKSHYHTILNWTRRDGIYGKDRKASKEKYEGIEQEI